MTVTRSHDQFVTEGRVLMWFSHTFSVASNFLMAMSRVQNVPASVRLIRLGTGRQVRFFVKNHKFDRHLSCQCRHCSGQPSGVPGGGPAMGESSQLPSRPGLYRWSLYIDDDEDDIDGNAGPVSPWHTAGTAAWIGRSLGCHSPASSWTGNIVDYYLNPSQGCKSHSLASSWTGNIVDY